MFLWGICQCSNEIGVLPGQQQLLSPLSPAFTACESVFIAASRTEIACPACWVPFQPWMGSGYCLSICQQWERPNQYVPLLPLLAQEPHGGLVMLRDASHQCPGPVSPFATVSFKDGEKEHEISKSQDIFAFVFPKEMDMESRLVWLCSLRLQAKKGTWENLHFPCISRARQAWTTHLYYFPILSAHQFVVLDQLTSRASPGSPVTWEVTGTP